MKQKTVKMLLSFLLTLVMVIGMMPGMGIMAREVETTEILDLTSVRNTVPYYPSQDPYTLSGTDVDVVGYPWDSSGWTIGNVYCSNTGDTDVYQNTDLTFNSKNGKVITKVVLEIRFIPNVEDDFSSYVTTNAAGGITRDGNTVTLTAGSGGAESLSIGWKFDYENTYFNVKTATVFLYGSTHSVTITAGSNMTKTADSGSASQTGLSGAMTSVVYTANDGYYFPENYSVESVNGISVTRNSYTQITVSGTPTADAAITLTAPMAKTTPSAPTTAAAVNCTTADNNDGKLTGVTTAMEYKKSDAESWTAGTGGDITGLVPGTYYVRVKATDTTLASDNQELTIKGFISYTVTFKVVNGSWDDGEGDAAKADRTVTLTGHEGELKLAPDQIPTAGTRPDDGFKAGSWDVAPDTETAVTEGTTYTYTYEAIPGFDITVKILGGETYTVNVTESETILSVKQKLAELSGIAVEAQWLIFKGKRLDNEKTITEYNIQKGSTLQLVERKHSHVWEYNADGNTVTAECKGDFGTCDITAGLTMIISAPSDLVCDGNAKAAALNEDYSTTAFPDEYQIKYYQNGTEIDAENVKNAGDYTAKVTVGTDEGAVTAEVSFTITAGEHQHTFGTDPRWQWRFIDGKAYAEAVYSCDCGETETAAADVVKGSENNGKITYTATDKYGSTDRRSFNMTFTVTYNDESADYAYGATCRLTAEEASDWTVTSASAAGAGGVVRAKGTKTFYFPVTESVTVEAKKSTEAQEQTAKIDVLSYEGGQKQFTYKVFWSLPEGAQVKSTMIYRSKDNGFTLNTADKLLEASTLRSYNMKLNVRNGEFNYTAAGLTSGTRQTVMAQVKYTLKGKEYTIHTDPMNIAIQ